MNQLSINFFFPRELNFPFIKTYANMLVKQGVSGVYGLLTTSCI